MPKTDFLLTITKDYWERKVKTCFVIMGYGIKNGLNLDLTYNKIIKPVIIDYKLYPYPLYEEMEFNAYRCDEICGTGAIDFKFVTCLDGADIVIADISTMNANAIYELGARHALKPRSTILLCAKEKSKEFRFFDLTYVPIIFYEHNGSFIQNTEISKVKAKLSKSIEFAINSKSSIPDNPIQRALYEKRENRFNHPKYKLENNLFQLYLSGCHSLDDKNYDEAVNYLEKLYAQDDSEENLLLLSLAQYKSAEKNRSLKSLIDCYNFLYSHADIKNTVSESLFGRLAAISLRIFNFTKDSEYYHNALEFYRRGSNYSNLNLYCPRNFCTTLLRIYEVTDDVNILKEYFYTAKFFAKLFLNYSCTAIECGSYEQRMYWYYNRYDLTSIINGEYANFDEELDRMLTDNDLTARQKDTILNGLTATTQKK